MRDTGIQKCARFILQDLKLYPWCSALSTKRWQGCASDSRVNLDFFSRHKQALCLFLPGLLRSVFEKINLLRSIFSKGTVLPRYPKQVTLLTNHFTGQRQGLYFTCRVTLQMICVHGDRSWTSYQNTALSWEQRKLLNKTTPHKHTNENLITLIISHHATLQEVLPLW